MINNRNWSHTHFKSEHSLAFLSIGGDTALEDNSAPEILYFLTVTDHEYVEIYQECYEDISLAIADLNKKYSHWELIDAENKSGSGCGSCAAH
jgi:hypothetical protein